MAKTTLNQHIQNIYSNDKKLQGTSYENLMKLTEEPVEWAYEIWDDLLDLLEIGNNRGRSIAAQVLSNLAKSDPDNRMTGDLPKLFHVTKDEKFVTARHSLLSLWKVAIVNDILMRQTIEGLEKRFEGCINEKNCTLIRYDITRVLRNIFDHTGEEQVIKRSISLIETETDKKYRKKYLAVWKDILKKQKQK